MNVAEFLAAVFQSVIADKFGNVADDATASFVDTGKGILDGLGVDTSGVDNVEKLSQKCVDRGTSQAGRILGGGRGGGGCSGGCCGGGCGKAAANAGAAAAGAAAAAMGAGDGAGGPSGEGGGAGEASPAAGDSVANAAGDALGDAGEAGEALGDAATDEGKEEMADDMTACTNPGCSPKPMIELGELAKHAVILGDVFMKLYNDHKHKEVKKGGDVTGVPVKPMTCKEHLSHVTFTIKDPEDQPESPGSVLGRAKTVGQKALAAAGGARGEPDNPDKPSLLDKGKEILDGIVDFCDNPGGVVGDAAKSAGVPDDVVACGQEAVNKGVKAGVDAAVTAVENAIGIDLPDMDTVCDIAKQVQEGKWLGAMWTAAKQAVKTIAPAVVTAVTLGAVPPHVTTAVLNGVEAILDHGGSLADAAKGAADIAEAEGGTGCEGLTALGGSMAGAALSKLTEGF